MKSHSITWKFSYMNDDGNLGIVLGSEKDEKSAINQLWRLGSKYKCKSIESYFTTKDGTVVQVSPLSGKVKRS